MSQKKLLEPLINWSSLKAHKDEVTYNKIRRHLTDINDTITEDDIRNIKIVFSVSEIQINNSKRNN